MRRWVYNATLAFFFYAMFVLAFHSSLILVLQFNISVFYVVFIRSLCLAWRVVQMKLQHILKSAVFIFLYFYVLIRCSYKIIIGIKSYYCLCKNITILSMQANKQTTTTTNQLHPPLSKAMIPSPFLKCTLSFPNITSFTIKIHFVLFAIILNIWNILKPWFYSFMSFYVQSSSVV